MPTLADDRTFESDIVLTPEEQQATAAYFEAKGVDVTFDSDKDKPAEQPVVGEPAPGAPPAGTPPAVAVPDESSDLDAESRADWQSATTDGERLGKYARRTKQLNELRDAVAKEQAEKVEIARKLAEVEGRLAERRASAPVVNPNPLEPPSPPAKAAEPPKAKQFDKVAPEAPEFNNFLDEPDPQAAFSAAMVKYVDEKSDWKLEKRDFEAGEAKRVETESNQQLTHQQQVNQKFKDVVMRRPDFYEKTKTVRYSGMLNGILIEMLDDGLDLGYELADSKHAELLNKINAYTDIDPNADPAVAQKAMQRAIRDLAVFAERLGQPEAAKPPEQAAPQIPAVPAAQPAAAAPPANGVPPVAPPNGQPRREEVAAPAHVKGHAATPAIRLEDVPADDYDARRAARRQLGQL